MTNASKFQRRIGELHGSSGPTAVFIGGIHGNEPSGVLALVAVFNELANRSQPIKGNVYMLAGNLKALSQQKRFISEDLNRIWTSEKLIALSNKKLDDLQNEEREQYELQTELNRIIDNHQEALYFMDLHTTSSATIPFMTVNDSLLNRKFTKQFPVPTILGIEEYLSGPILSHMNENGYVAFGFEGGQHADKEAINNHIAFIYLSLHYAEIIRLDDTELDNYVNRLKPKNKRLIHAFEIYHRHKIKNGIPFSMEPGFENFQFLDKDVLIATENEREIKTTRKGRIFMPLYQTQGAEGFFAIRKIPGFFLWVSRVLRIARLHQMFVNLPGISPNNNYGTFKVNRKKARFLTKQLIHLFGYRIIERHPSYYVIQSREMNARKKEYRKARWY